MNEEVFEYLHDYGFSAIDINRLEVNDAKTRNVTIDEARKNITFLEDKELDSNEIITIITDNSNMLYASNEQLEANELIVDNLNLDYISLRKLIKSFPRLYTCNTQALDDNIKYILSKVNDLESCKKIILSNPSLLGFKLDKLKEII